jgi:hypothetical protein
LPYPWVGRAVNLLLQHNTSSQEQKKMESIKTVSRIHPLMAAAAVSVVIVSIAGTAAITGMLPSSGATPAAPVAAQPSDLAPAPTALAAVPQHPATGPMLEQPAPEVKHSAPRPRVVHHSQVAHNDANQNNNSPVAQQAPAPAPQQAAAPNYVGIGVGAVVGGLLGNQVGAGNGKKLATVAGAIGGGMLGNEIANRNK